jgi:hypothetical protein
MNEKMELMNIIGIKPLWNVDEYDPSCNALGINGKLQCWNRLIGHNVVGIIIHQDNGFMIFQGVLEHNGVVTHGGKDYIYCIIDGKVIKDLTVMVKYSNRHLITKIMDFRIPEKMLNRIDERVKNME